jgi:hypothetical protein
MNSESGKFDSRIVFELLGVIWTPAIKAMQVRRDLNVRSLEETSGAAERAGIEVAYADLPANVSGFANLIEGKPHIVVNRTKSPEDQQYTVVHELGHHLLHLNPAHTPGELVRSVDGMADFQADMFAVGWIWSCRADGRKRQDVLKQNPESSIVVFSAASMTVVILGVALLVFLWSRISRAWLSSRREQT